MSQSEFCEVCASKSLASLHDVDAVSVTSDVSLMFYDYLSMLNWSKILTLLFFEVLLM